MNKQNTSCILFFLFIAIIGYSQSKIGVINDKDGFTNIRTDKNNKSEIIGKILDKEYFTFFENDDSNWWLIETENGQIGYLHKSRISFVKNGYILNAELTSKNVILSIKDQHLEDVIVKLIQLRPDEGFYDFNCRGLIRTIKANKLVDEKNYANIDPVGGNFGLTFSKTQNKPNLFIASKFGDYDGEIIIVDTKGTIQSFKGGQYFVTDNGKYLVSDWDSDLSGLTIYDLQKKQVCLNKELDFHLGKWYFTDGIYFTPVWNGEKEIEETYQIDFNNFRLKRSTLKIKEGRKIKMINQNCYCE